MFQPPIFRETRPEVMQGLMREHPFATLISSATGRLTADHVPLVLHPEVEGQGALRGHVAVANPLFRETDGPIEVMAIFQGPQTYVTPSWYASKRDHGKVVPTWNYVVVHASGTLRFVRETDWLLEHLHDLTAEHERDRELPWQVSDAPAGFIDRQLKGLVGFEIAISDLAGTWKVSQNKPAADRAGVRSGLLEDGAPEGAAISDLVEERGRR
ncbi:MAG: FMN-binding negative transcriptional regulator [Pseudomonadota bacterium]